MKSKLVFVGVLAIIVIVTAYLVASSPPREENQLPSPPEDRDLAIARILEKVNLLLSDEQIQADLQEARIWRPEQEGQTYKKSADLNALWMEPGGKDKVMKIGEARLEQNSDDIVGLIIKIGYYASKSDIDETLVVTEKLIEVGENIKSPAFSRRYATLLLSFKMMLLITPELEPEKLEFDPEKFARPVKFTMLEYIEACEEDGLF